MIRIGSRAQVMHGNAKMTGGGLKKKDLKYNKQGKIVSKKMSSMAKKEKRLQKAGYTTKKGQFKLFKKQYGGKYGNNISQSFSVANRQKLKEQYSVGHELLTSPINKEATNKSILDKLKNIKNSKDNQILLTSCIIKVLRSSLVPIEEEKLYTVIIDEINKMLVITEYKTTDKEIIMKDSFTDDYISTIVSLLLNNKLMYINVKTDKKSVKQQLCMYILQKIHKMNKLKNIQTSYGIIDERIVRDSIKDEILSHNYMQIWMGCYNTMYIDKPLVYYFKTYFKPYIDKLKSISKSCLIIVEPRIFSIYSTENIGKEAINIKNIVNELKTINVYLIDDKNNILLNKIIENFENYILILNMVEYYLSNRPDNQIPYLLEESLKSRMESSKKYTMHVSRVGIPYLIAEDEEQIELIKSIIRYYSNITSFDNRKLKDLCSIYPNNPFIRQRTRKEREEIGKFIKGSIEKYNEFTSYTHPIVEDCKKYKNSKERRLCNEFKLIRNITGIDDIIRSYKEHNIKYIYITIKNLPIHSNIMMIIIPEEYPLIPSPPRVSEIDFEYKNNDDYKINRKFIRGKVDDDLVEYINTFLREINYKNAIMNRLKKISISEYNTLYYYLKNKNFLQNFLDFYWDKKEKYKYPINAIKDLYSNLKIEGNYHKYYTNYNSIIINKNICELINFKKYLPHH